MLSHWESRYTAKNQYCSGPASKLIPFFTNNILLNPMLKICFTFNFSFFELTFHLLSAHYSSRVKLKHYFTLAVLLRELKMSCDCEPLWLGSGRCFQILDQKTHRKVVNRTNNFKATCFHMSDAGKLYDNVGKLIFLGSLHLQQKVLTADQ